MCTHKAYIFVKGDVDTWNMLTSPAEHVNIHIPLVWLQDYFQFGTGGRYAININFVIKLI